jgi:hypothetical protein
MLRKIIGNDIRTVVDLGCSDGGFMRILSKGEGWEIIGVELFKPVADFARRSGVYKKVFNSDVRKLPKVVSEGKFDLIFCSQVLEHLGKKDGIKAIKNWEKIGTRRLVITTTVGFMKYLPIEKREENNPWQKHISGWRPGELERMGFKVRGQGLRIVYGEDGLAKRFPVAIPILAIVSYLASPMLYFFPEYAAYMIAYKKI